MSMQSTRAQLIHLLDDEENKVIALSGKWGTGKSFLWEQLRSDSTNPKVNGALYASLFGLSDIDRVKLKLIQSAAPTLEKNPPLLESAKQFAKSSIKILEGVHKSFGAINDIGLLLAPAVLSEKLIVLDDIERKHDNLDIDELLGFIDEFTQHFKTRFLLILNSDQLNRRKVWETMREKVVDEELRLITSCDEAFEIAVGLAPSPWSTAIAEASKKCGLTNIRIVRKVIKAVNRVIGKRNRVSDAVLMRVVPPTVLLAAIHYKGIEDGPDLNFVLGFGQASVNLQHFLAIQEREQTEEEKRQTLWRTFLQELGIGSCNEFELLVVEFLQSGLFDVSKLSALIDDYEVEHEAITAQYAANTFLQKCFWEHRVTEHELLEEARNLAKNVHLLDAYTVTSFHSQLEELAGGRPLAEEALTHWIENFDPQVIDDTSLSRMHRRDVHPRIKALFKGLEKKAQADITVLDACKYIATNSGWNLRQEMALKLATVESFELTIRTAETSDLLLIMAKMLDFTARPKQYEQYFGGAMTNFVEACRRIMADPSVPRLAKILTHLFDEAKLGELLDSTEQSSGVSAIT